MMSAHDLRTSEVSQRHSQLDALAMALMVVLCASWGLQQVAIKVANDGVSPIFQAGIRSVVASALLWLWCLWRRVPLLRRDGSLLPGVIAGLLFAGEFCLIYLGLSLTNASRAVIFLYTAPFVVALGAHLFLPGERMRAMQALGLACAFLGILLAFADSLAMPTNRQLLGDSLILVAAVLWGATTVLVKGSRLATIPAGKTLLYQLAASALVLPPLSWAMGEPGIVALTPLIVASLAYQAVGVAFVSYLVWFWLVARYPASRLSAFSFLTPLFGVLAGGLLLDEPLTPLLMLAMILVGAGIWLVNRPPPVAAATATAIRKGG